jgi:hypothetical protein
MTRCIALAAAVALAACGSDDESRPAIEGDWLYVHDGGFDCATGASFGDDGTFELAVLCSLEGGGYGIQLSTGDYDVLDDDEVELRFTRSSCPGGTRETTVVRWRVEGDQLSLVDDAGAILLERNDAEPGGGAQVTVGCWGEDGSFSPHPLSAL